MPAATLSTSAGVAPDVSDGHHGSSRLTSEHLDALKQLRQAAFETCNRQIELTPLARGRREQAVGDWLEDHGIAHEVVSDGAQVGVVLKDVPLPQGKFDHEKADLLILLPAGYPDACPDMFYTFPWFRLIGAGRYPRCADVAHIFGSKRWQRWSRHSQSWRPGIDGLHTMIARA